MMRPSTDDVAFEGSRGICDSRSIRLLGRLDSTACAVCRSTVLCVGSLGQTRRRRRRRRSATPRGHVRDGDDGGLQLLRRLDLGEPRVQQRHEHVELHRRRALQHSLPGRILDAPTVSGRGRVVQLSLAALVACSAIRTAAVSGSEPRKSKSSAQRWST